MADVWCSLCPPERTSHLRFNLTDYLKHVKLIHSHQPGFQLTCGIAGCIRTFKNFRTFRDHVSTFNSQDPNASNTVPPSIHEDDNGDSYEGDDHNSLSHENTDDQAKCLQKSSALFLMGLKEKYKLTQVALQGVIEGATSLTQCRLDALRSQITSTLLDEGVSSAIISKLDACLSEDGEFGRPFLGLETQHQQMKFYRCNFNFVVSLYYIVYVPVLTMYII